MPHNVPTYSAAAVRAAEKPLLDTGVPLMRRAAHALAAVIAEHRPQRILVLAGSGDNGGDALYAAAEIAADGAIVHVLRTADRVHEEALNAAVAAGTRVVEADAVDAADCDLVIDGILGIGARGGLRGRARDIVGSLLTARPRVIAVDLPSGLDPDTGEADDVVLPARTTVTFGALKAGLARNRGPELAGRIVLVRLGLELTDAGAAASVDQVIDG